MPCPRCQSQFKLSVLCDFIAESETPIQAGQLKRIRIMLENDDELWSDAVKGAFEVVEAQCQATTQTVQGKLPKAKLLHIVSVKAHAKVVVNTVSKEKELKESEEAAKGLKLQLGRDILNTMVGVSAHGSKADSLRRLALELNLSLSSFAVSPRLA